MARGRGGCEELYPSAPEPREVAGAPIGSDVLKCQLRPVDLGNYDVTLTTEQRPSRPASATGRSPASAKPPRRTPGSALATRAPGSDGCLPSSGVGSKSACYRAQVVRVCIGQPPPRQRDQGMTAEAWTVVAGGIGLAGRPALTGTAPTRGQAVGVAGSVRYLFASDNSIGFGHRRRGRRADSRGRVSRRRVPARHRGGGSARLRRPPARRAHGFRRVRPRLSPGRGRAAARPRPRSPGVRAGCSLAGRQARPSSAS